MRKQFHTQSWWWEQCRGGAKPLAVTSMQNGASSAMAPLCPSWSCQASSEKGLIKSLDICLIERESKFSNEWKTKNGTSYWISRVGESNSTKQWHNLLGHIWVIQRASTRIYKVWPVLRGSISLPNVNHTPLPICTLGWSLWRIGNGRKCLEIQIFLWNVSVHFKEKWNLTASTKNKQIQPLYPDSGNWTPQSEILRSAISELFRASWYAQSRKQKKCNGRTSPRSELVDLSPNPTWRKQNMIEPV